MSACFSDRLDETLAELEQAGAQVVAIHADGSSMEAIFRERGESAILLDCDPNRDVGWYGAYEIVVSSDEGAAVTFRHGDHVRTIAVGEAPPPPTEPDDDEAERAAA
jgi:hypothetical protein